MKTIYYFSGTGNTLYLAKYLNKGNLYNLVDISMIENEEIVLKGDVGILFPVYAMGIPRIVENFLNKVRFEDINYIFAIATCGGSGYGIPFIQINNILKKRNLKLNYTEYCHMPDNYLKLFRAPTKEVAKIEIEGSKEKMNLILNNILNKNNLLVKNNFFLFFIFLLIYKFWRFGLKTTSKKFKLKIDRCTKCGICKDVCPTKNIELIDGNPIWGINCEDCLACVNLCPTLAISCGGKSRYDDRYRNPYININELKNVAKIKKV